MANHAAEFVDHDALMNRELALSRVGGDEELLTEIAEIFREEYPRNLLQLRDALARDDAYTVERVAHGLKGAIANFASSAGVAAALRLEQLGNAKDLSEAPAALDLLEKMVVALSVELEHMV